MKVTRYEFDETGIFHAMELFDGFSMEDEDAQNYKYAEERFECNLEIPDILSNENNIKTRSFFTEEGLKAFSLELYILCDLFERYCEGAGFGEMKKITLDIDEDSVVYQDEYQVLVRI